MAHDQPAKQINQVPLRDAETREEQLILGFLNQEAVRVGFGTIVLEFQVRGGKIDRVKSNEISRVFNIGGRDA